MGYQALYRKWRPDEFDEVKGQEHIVTTLQNQIAAGRIGHAYLFCGTRGTGKTTVAKLLAKTVNCENPVNGSPCGKCDSCRAISEQRSMNVIEMDAASNNGVDNIREIKKEIEYSPTDSKYKVFIIDEVHMLSQGAFNALLKTLEEPPAYIIFILATTEVHKIPVTILSRCQRYDFKRITLDTIADRLMDLMKREEIEVEEKAIRYVAKAADGSMRDALSLLDQCISFYLGKTLTYENVLEVLGAVDTSVLTKLFHYILDADVGSLLTEFDKMMATGREITQFVNDFTWYLRNLLFVQQTIEAQDMLEVSDESFEVMKLDASICTTEDLMRYIRITSDLSNEIKYSTKKRVEVELAFVKLCKPQMEQDYESILARLQQLEDKIDTIEVRPVEVMGEVMDKGEDAVTKVNIAKELEQKLEPEKYQTVKELLSHIQDVKAGLMAPLKQVFDRASITINETNDGISVAMEEIPENGIFIHMLQDKGELETLTKEFQKYVEQPVSITFRKIPKGQKGSLDFFDLSKISIPVENA